MGRIAGFDGPDHGCDIVPNRRSQVAEAGRRDPLASQRARAVDKRFHRDRIDADCAALVRQVEAHSTGIARMASGCLQDAQPGLHPIIGRQALADERRQQNIGLP